jgi:hypothetical protein
MDDLVSRRGTTAEEVLFALNGLSTVPLDRIAFAVITGTYTPNPFSSERQIWPFTTGDKEFLGKGRPDPLGWEDSSFCVRFEEDISGAFAVAELVRSDRPRGYYTWTEDGLTYAADQDAAHWMWAGDPEGWIRIGDFAGRSPDS